MHFFNLDKGLNGMIRKYFKKTQIIMKISFRKRLKSYFNKQIKNTEKTMCSKKSEKEKFTLGVGSLSCAEARHNRKVLIFILVFWLAGIEESNADNFASGFNVPTPISKPAGISQGMGSSSNPNLGANFESYVPKERPASTINQENIFQKKKKKKRKQINVGMRELILIKNLLIKNLKINVRFMKF